METNGTHWKQTGCFVANCFHSFLPQPARVREEACVVEGYEKALKNESTTSHAAVGTCASLAARKRKNLCLE
jgi:hypothetical protein